MIKNKPSIQQLKRKKNRMTTLINSALKENAALRDSSRTDVDDFDADLAAADKRVARNKNRDIGKKRGPRKQQYREDIERGIRTKIMERVKAADDNWLNDNWLIERNELDQEINQDNLPFTRMIKNSFDPFDY